MSTLRENERLFLEYCARLIALELDHIREALEEDGPVQSDQLFQERIAQLERAARLVKDLAEEDNAEPLAERLDRRIRVIQHRIVQLASQVYDQRLYPPMYWAADEDRGFLVELLSAWQRWNNPDHIGPVLNV